MYKCVWHLGSSAGNLIGAHYTTDTLHVNGGGFSMSALMQYRGNHCISSCELLNFQVKSVDRKSLETSIIMSVPYA